MLEKVHTPEEKKKKKDGRNQNKNFTCVVYNLTVIGHNWKQAALLDGSVTGGMLINIAMSHQDSMRK